MSQSTNVQSLRAPAESNLPAVAPGFGSLQSFELMQRAANLLSSSTLVPAAYRKTIEKLDRYGNVKESRENPNALANSVVALNMAQRMGADPLMVMQNLYIVEGRPSWSSQWIIAAINGCGRFSPLRFDIKVLGAKTVEYKSTYWEDGQRRTKVDQVEITDKVCIAWAIEKETGERLESPAVSIEMAVKEGWYTKNGSKWQTMDEVMLRYRTASFFGKLYAPELLMGLQTVEEAQDIIEATTGPDGTISVNVDDLRAAQATASAAARRQPADVADVDPETGEVLNSSPAKAQAEAGKPAQGAAAAAPASREDRAQGTLAGTDDAGLDPAQVEAQLMAAKDLKVLDLAADSIGGVLDALAQAHLEQVYEKRRQAIQQAALAEQQAAAGQASGQRPVQQRRRMAAPE
ncbi:hypothetical protein [Bordetella genomosp. 2]|uniref:Recombinase RecT n=1 Tax=Bordetella genomosp. 2 TaxID=1983456 RepID=A0A261W1X8_9BORD|nr:hypothetical protein [Bordetella genomosp. 2]OZI79880.1 hypothetical protein CAL24_08180 [Bordetella genomosp. 2]